MEDARDLARQLLALAEDAAQRFPPASGDTSENGIQIKPVFDAEAVAVAEPEAETEGEGDGVPATANGEGEVAAEELPDTQAGSDSDATAVMPPQHPVDNGTSGD